MFKKGDIVYCIDNTTMYSDTSKHSLKKLELNKPYNIKNNNGGSNDINLQEIDYIFYSQDRFISEHEYKSTYRRNKLKKLKDKIWQYGE